LIGNPEEEISMTQPKLATCLWFDRGQGRAAAEFYASVFPDTHLDASHAAPSDNPSTAKGEELMVEFTLLGQKYLGLNGGPNFKPNEAVSFMVYTDTQEETDRYWNAIVGNGGQESECGWCKDRWGFSWQITPRALMDAMAAGGSEAKRAFDAMMTMRKIDIATIEAARRGEKGRA
jgi:predicted 3-demethylubiquinone-9 3-methyltransferase (glyoxalase superfamily)